LILEVTGQELQESAPGDGSSRRILAAKVVIIAQGHKQGNEGVARPAGLLAGVVGLLVQPGPGQGAGQMAEDGGFARTGVAQQGQVMAQAMVGIQELV
jgi:hypothetical protein